jgi:CheY-like chemotaxis protein
MIPVDKTPGAHWRALDTAAKRKDSLMSRILIVDDDPISLEFLRCGIAQTGADVLAVATGAAALDAATDSWDLLMLDRCMPDIGGTSLLAALRLRGCRAAAVATTAQADAATTSQLLAGGFIDIIRKPITLARLHAVISQHVDFRAACPVSRQGDKPPPLFDDASAFAAIGGNAKILHALRALLAQELTSLAADLRSDDCTQTQSLYERMHRLRASCGFCGAPALAAAAVAVQRAARSSPTTVHKAVSNLLDLCRLTAGALTT